MADSSLLLSTPTMTEGSCAWCQTPLTLTRHQLRRSQAQHFCLGTRCRDRYWAARYRATHPNQSYRRRTHARTCPPEGRLCAGDQDYLGGGDTAQHLLPPYPPHRCTCVAGEPECHACSTWRGVRGTPGPAARKAFTAPLDATPPDWRTAAPEDVYQYWLRAGQSAWGRGATPYLWSADALMACGLAWMRRHQGHPPLVEECTKDNALPSIKAIRRVYGTMRSYCEVLYIAWKEGA